MQLSNKLSAKEILGNVLTVVKSMEVGEIREAFGVAGLCTAYETGVSQFGQWVRFCGDLQATNYLTGEIIRAPKAHVPDILEDLIMTGVKEHASIEKTKCTEHTQWYKLRDPIEFAYKVDLERLEDDDNGAVKYKYITKPLTEVATNDAIGHLTALLEPPKPAEGDGQKAPKTSRKKAS